MHSDGSSARFPRSGRGDAPGPPHGDHADAHGDHADAPHSDVHGDYVHGDATASPHVDLSHFDIRHLDTGHLDWPHLDHHTDEAHVDDGPIVEEPLQHFTRRIEGLIEQVEQRQQIAAAEAMHKMGQGLTQLARQVEEAQKKLAAIEKRVDRLAKSRQ